MTYEQQYNLRSVPGVADQTGLTLYEACKALNAAGRDGRVQDATRITRGLPYSRERFVAFFCGWRKDVRPAFGALDSERNVLYCWRTSQY